MPNAVRSVAFRNYILWAAVIACLLPLQARAGLPWGSVGPGGGTVVSLAIDPTTPGTLYAGTSGAGLFKSVDGGDRWSNTGLVTGDTLFTRGTNVYGLAIDPATPQTLYAGTLGRGMFKSTNGGASWSEVNSGLTELNVTCLAIDPASPQTLYAGTYFGAFKSIDGAATWEAAGSGLVGIVQSLAIDPMNRQTLYATTYSHGVFKSTDGGTGWSAANTGLTDLHVFSLAIDPSTPQTLYAGTGHGVFKSADGGASWNAVHTGMGTPTVARLEVDPNNPQAIYAGTYSRFFRSTNGGATWVAVDAGLEGIAESLIIDPINSQNLYVGTYRGVFKSTNAGDGWSAVNAGLINLDVLSLAIDQTTHRTLYAGTHAGLYRSTDGGAGWSSTGLITSPFSIGVTSLAIDPSDSRILYAGTSGGVYKSTDGGAGWREIDLDTDSFGTYVFSLAIDPADPRIIYAGTNDYGLYKSTNGGADWSAINTGLTDLDVFSLAIDPATPQTVYAGTNGGVFKSTNGGTSWTAGNTISRVQGLAIDPSNPRILYAASDGGVFKSTDGGAGWSAVNAGLIYRDVFSLAINPVHPDTLYAGTRGGVFKSTDGGSSWNAVQTGMGTPVVASLAIDPANPEDVYAGTISQGVFKTLRVVASLGQAFAGPVGEGRAFTTILLVNRDSADCRATLVFSQGTATGPPVLLNGQPGNFWTKSIPSGGAERVVLTADALSQGIVSVFTLNPCGSRSLSVSGSYLIEAPDGSIQEAFTIRPNSEETWLTPNRCAAISTFQDPHGDGDLTQNLGLAVSNNLEDREAPAGTRLDLSFFDADGNPAGQGSIPVTGSHTASFPLPEDLEGDLTTVFCLDVPGDSTGTFDLTAVNVLQKNGFQFDSRLFADVFESGDVSAWPAQQAPDGQLHSGEEPAIVASLGQAFAGPVGEDTALATITLTNRDLTDCQATLTFSRGAAAGPPVSLNGRPGNSLTTEIPSGGLSRVLLTADELVQGIVTVSVPTPCGSDSLSISGNYLVLGADGALKEAFTIRPNTEQTWLKAGRCAVITTFQDPQGDDGLIQNLGLAVSSVTPGQEVPAGTELNLFFFDAEGEPLGQESMALNGVHATGFPLPVGLKGIVTTVFCLDTAPDFSGAFDLTAINLLQKGGFQFDSRLFVDLFESGDQSAWSKRFP